MRHEFSKETKRAALTRAGNGERSKALCEATGEVYGLPEGQRCNVSLAYGVEFDHYPEPAGVKGSDALDNCVAVCPKCHKHKTRTFDIPAEAKIKRVQDRHQGIKKPPTFHKPEGTKFNWRTGRYERAET